MLNKSSIDKNFAFDITSKTFTIGDVELNKKLKEENAFALGYEYYHDYQDKFIYTLKQRLHFKNDQFKVTIVFKGTSLWLIELHHENDDKINEALKTSYKELFLDIKTETSETADVEIQLNSNIRIEYK